MDWLVFICWHIALSKFILTFSQLIYSCIIHEYICFLRDYVCNKIESHYMNNVKLDKLLIGLLICCRDIIKQTVKTTKQSATRRRQYFSVAYGYRNVTTFLGWYLITHNAHPLVGSVLMLYPMMYYFTSIRTIFHGTQIETMPTGA